MAELHSIIALDPLHVRIWLFRVWFTFRSLSGIVYSDYKNSTFIMQYNVALFFVRLFLRFLGFDYVISYVKFSHLKLIAD